MIKGTGNKKRETINKKTPDGVCMNAGDLVMKQKKFLFNNNAVLTLILINVMIFILLNVFPALSGVFLLDPNPASLADKPWTVLTVFFSHEILIHLLVNVFLIFIFGTQLYRETNGKVVYGIYMLSGLLGSLTSLAYASLIGYDAEPMAGASAAAFGIAGAYAALQPDAVILKSKSKYWLIALFTVNAVLTVQNPQVSVGGPAHAAGIVAGVL